MTAWRRGGSTASFSSKFEGQLAEIEIDFRRALLFEAYGPVMNLSGRSVGQADAFLQVVIGGRPALCATISSLPVDVNCGSVREVPTAVRRASAISRPITSVPISFPALRIGIGDNDQISAVDYVLSKFRGAERSPPLMTL